jgi:hypothetical protein
MGGGTVDDNNPSVERMRDQLESLDPCDQEHPSVRLVHQETGWGVEVFASGLVVLQNSSIRGSQKHMRGIDRENALALWHALARGDIASVMKEPWLTGYGS